MQAVPEEESTGVSPLELLELLNAEAAKRAAGRLDPNFILNPKQKLGLALLMSGAPWVCFVGGARSGKTFETVLHIVQRALDAPGSRHLIARYRYNACIVSIWRDTLPAVMRLCFSHIPGVEWREGDKCLIFANGSEIWMDGLDEKERLEKILGREYATIFLNEVSQIPYASVALVRTRLAQKVVVTKTGLILAPQLCVDLNPTGSAHWTHKMFLEKLDPDTFQPLANRDDYKFLFWTPYDNRANLPEGYIEKNLETLPARQRKRFLEGVYVAEVEGALWTIENLERQRIELLPGKTYRDDFRIPSLKRIVVAVDPSGTKGEENQRSNEVGIIVAGLGVDNKGYVLDDLTVNEAPEKWAQRVVTAYAHYYADVVVAEINYGGDMVRATIHSKDRAVKVRVVTASRGKVVRAEPVSTLYEQNQVHHVGQAGKFIRLEDQMLNFSTAGYLGSKSPDRADALVWALTELMVKKPKTEPQKNGPRVLPIYGR